MMKLQSQKKRKKPTILKAGLPVYEWDIMVLYFSQLEPLDLQHFLQPGAQLGRFRKQKKSNNMPILLRSVQPAFVFPLPLSPSPALGI